MTDLWSFDRLPMFNVPNTLVVSTINLHLIILLESWAELGSGQGCELYIKNVCLSLDNCQNLFQLE
jgi:hypothetical protein